MLHQNYNFYLTRLSILIACLPDIVWILHGEVTSDHFWELRVNGILQLQCC